MIIICVPCFLDATHRCTVHVSAVSQHKRLTAHITLLLSNSGQDAGCKKILKPLLKKHQVNLDCIFGQPLVHCMATVT